MDIKTAIKLAGTKASLARILTVTPAAVWQWENHKKALPPLQVYRLKERCPEWFVPKSKKQAKR